MNEAKTRNELLDCCSNKLLVQLYQMSGDTLDAINEQDLLDEQAFGAESSRDSAPPGVLPAETGRADLHLGHAPAVKIDIV